MEYLQFCPDVADWTTNNYELQYTIVKCNMAMKLGQLMKYSVEIFFFKNRAEYELGRLVLDLVLFFKKALYKATWSTPQF